MGFFTKRNQHSGGSGLKLPAGFANSLELYGRQQFDRVGSGIDSSQIGGGNFEYENYMLAQPDHDAFISAVTGAAIATGGWALYGGERAVMNSVGYYPELTHPDYLTLLDRAIEFVHLQGYAAAQLPPYMNRRWADTH